MNNPEKRVCTAQKCSLRLALLLFAACILVACLQPTPIVQIVRETVVVTSVVVKTEVHEIIVTATPEPPVRGGLLVVTSSHDITTLNPILSSDSASSRVQQYIYPSLIGEDPLTGEIVPTELAESWSVSDDGLIWTFKVRQDVVWSDGEQVDANDFKFTYDAIAAAAVLMQHKPNIELIKNIEVADDFTLVVTLGQVKCDGLRDLGLGILPSHLYAADFSDIMTSAQNEAPTVSAGPFLFNEWVRGESITLLRNDRYFKGAPHMDGLLIRTVPDAGARLAQLQAGEIDTIPLQPDQLTVAQLNPNLKVYTYKDDGYDYIALNLADPANPQPGLDEDGNKVEQGLHPILSDLSVRQAIAHALDYSTIIAKIYLGQGYPLASNVLPTVAWAYNSDIQPYEFDTAMAAQILEDAGWVDSDGDGVREKDGRILTLRLQTNADNTPRQDLGALVQSQLNGIGFAIQFEALELDTLVGELLGQTFDLIIIGWTGLGSDPNDDNFWALQSDIPGSGFNFVSFSNDRVDELLKNGLSVPGCDPAVRAPYYKEIQQIIHDEIPYIFMTGSIGNTGYAKRWQGVDPGPWSFYWNVEEWTLQK